MAGLSPRLPLVLDAQDGYKLNKTYKELVQQNLANLLLTVPGERIMNPEFGVGLKRYLFELDTDMLRDELSGKINEQVSRYLPFVNVTDISFRSAKDDESVDPNFMYVEITYIITPLEFEDKLDITIPNY